MWAQVDLFSSEFFTLLKVLRAVRQIWSMISQSVVFVLSLKFNCQNWTPQGTAHTHEPQSLHTSFHALHLLLPRKLIAQAWCHYIPEHRREKKGKEKMANKGWIVTIFAFKSENMALNRFYKVWTLFTHVHFPHQKTFGILHLIMIISSWMHLRAANPLSIRCAHMCYRSIH